MRTSVFLLALLLACDSAVPEADSAARPQAPSSEAPDSVPTPPDPAMAAGESTAPPAAQLGDGAGPVTPPSLPTVSWLDRYDFDERLWHVDLPGRLDEVSGLAFDSDGRLFAHDDEVARVHEIDPASGEVIARFDVGHTTLRGDFEGVAVAGERHFLVSSDGLLYEYRHGEDRASVDVRMTDTSLGSVCEVEGLDVLDDTDLLFACKTTSPERGRIELMRLPLNGGAQGAPILMDRDLLRETEVDVDFAPSGVAITPSGTIAILSGRHEALIEIDREGALLHAVELRRGRHPQSEGIAFGPDGTLYIADEKNGQDARLTAYAPVREGGRG